MAKVKVKKKKKQALGFFSPSSQIPRLASGAPMSKVYKAKVPQASTKAAGSYTESAGTVVPAHVPDLKLSPDLSPVKISESPNTLSAVEGSSSGPAPSDELNHPPTPSQVMGENLTKPASPNLANLIQRSAQLEELDTPSTHISGAPFVLILDENIEEAKEEFKEFIFARFQGDIPSKGCVIGVVNAVWARNGPRIFVHRVGHRCFLLKVTNERTRNVLLSRPAWMIAGSPMFVAPWSSDFSKEEPQLTTAVIPVELHGVPYLLFNKQSLSRLKTAIRKPESLAPETERKENFEVAKIWVWVSLLTDLPDKIITGFSNGREVEIDVSYPWLPKKCTHCDRYGHDSARYPRSTAIYKQDDS